MKNEFNTALLAPQWELLGRKVPFKKFCVFAFGTVLHGFKELMIFCHSLCNICYSLQVIHVLVPGKV